MDGSFLCGLSESSYPDSRRTIPSGVPGPGTGKESGCAGMRLRARIDDVTNGSEVRMGATLRYAKVIDRDDYQRRGGTVTPGLESVVELTGAAPADAAPFYVLRSYGDEFDAFTETWRILDPHGRTVHEPVDREVLTGQGEIADEVVDQHFEYADDGYQLVIEIDGREVARVDFPVREPAD